MTIRVASPRVLVFSALAGIVVSCADPAPSATNSGTGGSAGGGGAPNAGGSTSVSGSTTTAGVTSSTGGTTPTGTAGKAAGGAGGTGGAAAAGTAGSSGSAPLAGTGGTGDPGPVVVPQVCNIEAAGKGDGQIDYERWLDVVGTGVAQIPVGTAPATTAVLTELRQVGTGLDTFGARIRGYLTAPLSGAYRFWISGDDNCELWVSTSDAPSSKLKVARVEGEFDGWTNDQQWNKFASQKSADITLEQGKRYYLEVLHKDGVNLDHVAVGWQLPGESGALPCEVVPGNALSRLSGSSAGERWRRWRRWRRGPLNTLSAA